MTVSTTEMHDEPDDDAHLDPLGGEQTDESLGGRPELLGLLRRGAAEHVAVGLTRGELRCEGLVLDAFSRGPVRCLRGAGGALVTW